MDMPKLDKKDRKLLYYLSKNARTPYTQLAKLAELSQNSAKYRVERLRKEGVIKHFASVVNLGSINYSTFTVLLKFNEDIYEKPEIIAYFRLHKLADWVVTLSGNWDIFAEFAAKDFRQMDGIIKEIRGRFSESLSTYQVYFSEDTLRVEHLVADFYQGLELEELPAAARASGKYGIDSTDMKILKELNKDSSMHFLDIAKKAGLTTDIVRYRVKNLVEKGIIIKFFPEVSLPKLGYTEYLCTLKLKNVSKEKMHEIRNTIRLNNNITYAFVDINSFSIVFVCAFRDAEGIDRLSRNLRKKYSSIIDEQNYLIIKEQVLFNLFPDGIVE